MKVIECRIGNSNFGLEIDPIEGAIQSVIYKEFLGQNKYTLGFFVYRGENKQLIDLTKILKGKYTEAYENQIIVLLKNYDMGLLVDEIVGITKFDDSILKKPTENIPNYKYVKYIVSTKNFPIYDIEKIVKKVLGRKRGKNGTG